MASLIEICPSMSEFNAVKSTVNGALQKTGGTMTGTITQAAKNGVSYVAGSNGSNAGLYVRKGSGSVWYPAVCLETAGGGAWQIGNYDDETIEFQYVTAANRSSNTNISSEIYMKNGDTGRVLTTGNTGGSAITNITRSGTTFTATRVNGTTFTFTQQDNNTDALPYKGVPANGTNLNNLTTSGIYYTSNVTLYNGPSNYYWKILIVMNFGVIVQWMIAGNGTDANFQRRYSGSPASWSSWSSGF